MLAKHLIFALCFLLGTAGSSWAEQLTIDMYEVTPQGPGKKIGTIVAESSPYGVLFQPDLRGLAPPGPHGFHVHENPSCAPSEKGGKVIPGGAAGGHFDPGKTRTHAGPYGTGHLGDLPALCVEQNSTVTVPVLAPRLQLSDLPGHALVIHQGGDTYSDQPNLGGGGPRLACGVIKEEIGK
jgi:Cu-Zn family superoxide dismutase